MSSACLGSASQGIPSDLHRTTLLRNLIYSCSPFLTSGRSLRPWLCQVLAIPTKGQSDLRNRASSKVVVMQSFICFHNYRRISVCASNKCRRVATNPIFNVSPDFRPDCPSVRTRTDWPEKFTQTKVSDPMGSTMSISASPVNVAPAASSPVKICSGRMPSQASVFCFASDAN